METTPDFFLSALGESEELSAPRACWVKGRLKDVVRDDHMLIGIKPCLTGQKYGLGDQDIDMLIISARYEGSSLFPIREWPCHVYVARLLDQRATKTLSFSSDQVEVIAWGMIFPTLDAVHTYSHGH